MFIFRQLDNVRGRLLRFEPLIPSSNEKLSFSNFKFSMSLQDFENGIISFHWFVFTFLKLWSPRSCESQLQEGERPNIQIYIINNYPANLIYLNFYPLEVVSRYRDSQLQVCKNYSYLFNLRPNICKSLCLNTHFVPNISDLRQKTVLFEMQSTMHTCIIHCTHRPDPWYVD